MITGSVERHSPTTTLLWENKGPAEALCYRCADGEYVQLWFGAKGAFEAFLERIQDPPSEAGYNAELAGAGMKERGERWAAMFATRDRDWWVADLAGRKFRCEPVLRPGQGLSDPHTREIGLAVGEGGQAFLGPAVTVTPAGDPGRLPADNGRKLLEGVDPGNQDTPKERRRAARVLQPARCRAHPEVRRVPRVRRPGARCRPARIRGRVPDLPV
jgi:crotonobetainyl-CoA:carnitine CoA-transferase CaiB-like acyl-CoA transferase